MKRLLLTLLLACALLPGQNPETPAYPTAVATDGDLLVATDSAWSNLDGAINDTTLTVTVIAGSHFAYPSVVKINDEMLKVCSISGNVLTICSGGRGFAGTSAAGHSSGALVEDVVTAKHHNLMAAELKAIETALGASLANVQKTSEKNAASGYAGLSAGTKLNAAQGQEVWAVADLSDATAKSGTGTLLASTTGTQTSGRCVEIDANGNHIAAAAACGSGGGASDSRDLTDLAVSIISGTRLDFAAGAFGTAGTSYTMAAGYWTIQSRTVSDITEGSTTTFTTSAALGAGFHNGDSVNVAGVTGTSCSTLNALHVITVTGASTFTVAVDTTALTCTGGTVTGTGNGTAYVYGNSSGEIVVEVPAASGVIAICSSGSCIVNQVTTPAFNGIQPLATVTIVSGAWGVVTDARTMLGKNVYAASTGISIASGAIAIDTATVPQLGGTNVWTGSNDSTNASSTAPNKSGTTAPATCEIGQTFIDTDAAPGSKFLVCADDDPDTWEVQGGGSSSYAILAQNWYDNSIAAGLTLYNYITGGSYGPWQATYEAGAEIVIPTSCTASNFHVWTGSTQPATGSLVLTLRKNRGDTALVVTVAANDVAGVYSDTTHTVSYTAGDRISVKGVNNASGGSAVTISGSIRCQ